MQIGSFVKYSFNKDLSHPVNKVEIKKTDYNVRRSKNMMFFLYGNPLKGPQNCPPARESFHDEQQVQLGN